LAARRYTLLDVFTSTRLQGNPLAVVHDADGIPDQLMHAFARETRLSETSFIQTADDPAADYRNRIWAVTGELPFAGHPSLGVAAAVARERGEAAVTFHQQTRAGIQPVDVELAGGVAHCSMLQEPLETGKELDPAEVMTALGLEPAAAHPELPCQVASTGLRHVLAPVRDDPGALRAIRPDPERVGRLLDAHGATCLYAAVLDTDGARARARSFFPGGEDPATGSAAGPLCAWLAGRTGVVALEVAQGVEMGRASRISCRMEGDRVRVGGDVAVIIDGTVDLDG
jgi:trans-2,3-dihydro-3-hydroxyanthranilate isomerase